MPRSRSIAIYAGRLIRDRHSAADRDAGRLSMRAAIALIGGLSLLAWAAAFGLGRYLLG